MTLMMASLGVDSQDTSLLVEPYRAEETWTGVQMVESESKAQMRRFEREERVGEGKGWSPHSM